MLLLPPTKTQTKERTPDSVDKTTTALPFYTMPKLTFLTINGTWIFLDVTMPWKKFSRCVSSQIPYHKIVDIPSLTLSLALLDLDQISLEWKFECSLNFSIT